MAKRRSSKIKFSFSFREEYALCRQHIREAKPFIFFSVLLFALSAVVGFFFPIFFHDQILAFLEQLVSETDGLGIFQMIFFLFQNNATSAFFGMVFGVFFGIFPLFTSIFNGYLVGFVANKTVAADGFGVLWRLFPHGIFELPALFLSLGLGLQLSRFLFQKKNKLSLLVDDLTGAFRVFLFVVLPLLLIAAIIEGTLIVLLG